MQKLAMGSDGGSPGREDVNTPNENDLLITRLVARIAELEERLYKQELEAPAIVQRTPVRAPPLDTPSNSLQLPQPLQQVQQQQAQQQLPQPVRLKDAFLATLRESWAKLEVNAGSAGATAQQPVTATTLPATPVHAATAAAVTSGLLMASPTGATAAAGDGGSGLFASTPSRGGTPSMKGARGRGDARLRDGPASRGPSASDLQADSFNFSTHLVVDYSKPTRGSSSADGDAAGGVSDVDDGDDNDSLSSVDSTGMGYDIVAEERQRERRGSHRSIGSGTTQVAGGGGSGGGGAVAADGRPPLPPGRSSGGRGSSSDGGGIFTTGNPPPPPPPPPPPSRAAAWSGNVLSKLGLPWGRDRGDRADPRDGGSLPRNVSAGSLQTEAFSVRALEEQLVSGGGLSLVGGGTSSSGGGGHYYRYVFDPADVQAEMEVTARVRRAAAEALTEANAKLAEAQAAAVALQRQVEQAKELELELEVLRAERSAAQAAKAALEDDMAAVRRQLEGMKDTEASLQAELESMRSQADIWRSSKDGEAEKLKQENTLLRSQLTTRLNELQACRGRLSEGEAERQRLLRDAEELQNKIQWLTKINLQLETAASQLNDARKVAAEWQERFMRERNVRRRLHDQLQQLRGNIRVMCRVRPVQVGQRDIVTYPLEGLLAVSPPDRKYQEFEFDHVFPPSAQQSIVFEEAVAPLVRSVADGYNACIFAFGQTGAGKTYTMQGPSDNPGIYLRVLRELFRIAREEDGAAAAAAAGAAQRRASSASGGGSAAADGAEGGGEAAGAASDGGAAALGRFSFLASMLEIYNEAVYDLLAAGEGAVTKPLEVISASDLPPGQERVPGLSWRPVSSTEDAEALLREAGRNRATAATALNASSSRSHMLLAVRAIVTGPDGRRGVSQLHLVDLAGSERIVKSEVTGQRLKEAQSIGRSLGALGDVIAALQRRSSHIPFRNSKLTGVLQDSLRGNSKVLVVCNIAPESTSANETTSSLNFASRAAQVELGVTRRASDRSGPSGNLNASDCEGGGGISSRGSSGSAPSMPQALPTPPPPPLPIMNGPAAAKGRTQAATGSAAAGPGGVRTSASWVAGGGPTGRS